MMLSEDEFNLRILHHFKNLSHASSIFRLRRFIKPDRADVVLSWNELPTTKKNKFILVHSRVEAEIFIDYIATVVYFLFLYRQRITAPREKASRTSERHFLHTVVNEVFSAMDVILTLALPLLVELYPAGFSTFWRSPRKLQNNLTRCLSFLASVMAPN